MLVYKWVHLDLQPLKPDEMHRYLVEVVLHGKDDSEFLFPGEQK